MDSHSLPIGTILDRKYKILSLIGSGGFGITYKAEQIYLGDTCVIKEFFLSGKCVRGNDTISVHTQGLSQAEFERFKQSFLTEARILKKLKHVPHTPEISDFFEENNTAYMVMPFIESEDLQHYLSTKPNKLIPEKEALTYFDQIATALIETHKAGIIHRDIKPANILIGKDGNAYLIDFGAAREFIAAELSRQKMTIIFTHGYAPLEQYQSIVKRSPTLDIYALGALLYRILTGTTPMPSLDRTKKSLPPPNSLNPAISPRISAAIMKAMEMEPENRFQTVKEMKTALQEIIPSPNPEEIDWSKTLQANTLKSYQIFLTKYPQSKYAPIALKRIADLKPAELPTQTIERGKNLQAKPTPAIPNSFWDKYKFHTIGATSLILLSIWLVPKMQENSSSISNKMISFQGATFTMGEGKEAHNKTINSFSISEHELTFEEYDAFCKATGCTKPDDSDWGRGQRPVINVSWYDAIAYCNWRSKQEGFNICYTINDKNVRCDFTKNGYRLPTEAEWEYAARSGGKIQKYAGTDWEVGLGQYANYNLNELKTLPVKSKQPNEKGLYDMSGNVLEWCWNDDITVISNKIFHASNRGGCFGDNASNCASTFRNVNSPTKGFAVLGFRLARTY